MNAVLPYVKNKVFTHGIDNNDTEFTIRIYSDCFSSYRQEDFTNTGYILHRMNYSICFCQGMLHTNSIEGIWSSIKRISNNFAGINFKILEGLENNGNNLWDYLDGWICFFLFIRGIEKNKLNDDQTKSFLIVNLLINWI